MAAALTLAGHAKDLGGGFTVRRLLPDLRCRAVGPFVFFDHFGPVTEHPDDRHDVRPHPHIGLATVTYLFEGAMLHRDSLGTVQRIEPGAVNWMLAGRGIAHSERKPEDLRERAYVNHGLQLWVALPESAEEADPSFTHVPAEAIPAVTVDDAQVRVLAGAAFGVASPVPVASHTLYLDVAMPQGGRFTLPALAPERAVYPVSGNWILDGQVVALHQMQVLPEGAEVLLQGSPGSRCVVVGGEPLGPRHMWWNFVSSRKERIVQASADWEAGRFPGVPGETEFIPLPAVRFTPPEPMS